VSPATSHSASNRHKQTNLWDKGILGDDRLTKGPTCDARRLKIIPTINGPLLLRGEVERMPVMVKEADLNRVEVPGDYEIIDATEDPDVVQWTLL
jgi:hypothetical protein